MANILQLYTDILYLHGLNLYLQSSENQTLLLRFAFLQVTSNQMGTRLVRPQDGVEIETLL